jgi:hypothetical protein
MNSHIPDRWVIIRFKGDDPHYRVLAAWGGGYTQGASWRMNSGILAVEVHDSCFAFIGSTRSVYYCGKHSYGLTIASAGVYTQLKERYGDAVEIMPEETDWTTISY